MSLSGRLQLEAFTLFSKNQKEEDNDKHKSQQRRGYLKWSLLHIFDHAISLWLYQIHVHGLNFIKDTIPIQQFQDSNLPS